MKKLYAAFSLCSFFWGFSQINLNQPETQSRVITDPVSITLSSGFSASSANVEFIARIQETQGNNPPSSGGGSTPPTNPIQGGTLGSNNFHDTQGNIEVNGSGQLQFTLPIALPPGVKSVAPQMNLVYTSGSSNGIAGYGWNLSGITSISRTGKNKDRDGEQKAIELNNNDYYTFNGQRLILKSGQYGKDGSEYVTEKFSNVKIKAKGALSGKSWEGPEFWEVTFEDGSQAWYGAHDAAKTPTEYNITKWKDAQGNYIVYHYTLSDNVTAISRIEWGGNETLNKPHFNEMKFHYTTRDLKESSFLAGQKFVQDKILTSIQVNTNGNQFKKYEVTYHHGANGTKYQFVDNITEYNAQNQAANPIIFEYEKSVNSEWVSSNFSDNDDSKKLVGDFDGDGKLDFIKYLDAYKGCVYYDPIYSSNPEIDKKIKKAIDNDNYDAEFYPTPIRYDCLKEEKREAGLYLFKGAFDDIKSEKIAFNEKEFSKKFIENAITISLKNKNNVVKSNQGLAISKKNNFKIDSELNREQYDLEISIYSVQNDRLVKEYTKIIPNSFYEKTTESRRPYIDPLCRNPHRCMISLGYTDTSINKLENIDINGDGISELVLVLEDNEYEFDWSEINKNINPYRPSILEPETKLKKTRYRYLIIDPNSQNGETPIINFYDKKLDFTKIGDFDGDGNIEFLVSDNEKQYSFVKMNKNADSLLEIKDVPLGSNTDKLEGLISDAFTGDFNGDGKTDLLIPQKINSDQWNLYISLGNNSFKKQTMKLSIYRPNPYSTSSSHFGRHYLVRDLNQDGKSDFILVGTYSDLSYSGDDYPYSEFSTFLVKYYENMGSNSHEEIELQEKNIDQHSQEKNIYRKADDYRGYPFGYYQNNEWYMNIPDDNNIFIKTNKKLPVFSPLIGNFYINQSNHQIVMVSNEKIVRYSHNSISQSAYVTAITQGGLRTEIKYKELDPNKHPNFYKSVKSEQYPYMEMEKVSGSYAVAQLRQILSDNEVRKQDFRYRGFITHLGGKGIIGFRQAARSSWYADGFENTKIWSGAEIDPINEALPTKEWSIKTNNEEEIFPKDLSFNNQNLLSFKTTEYRIDRLVGGMKVASLSPEDKPKSVTAIVPVKTTTKDFQRDVTTLTSVEYDSHYLPTQTIVNTNHGFAEKITALEYYPANLSGEGKDYYVGRPRSKTELVRAYGDSKGAKEDYIYENNLLKSLKSWNRDNSGWIQESYEYDGFGNITSKTISNSFDSNTQKNTTQYDDKGRFVIKKIDNLGLETSISYNDWGQVLTQTDPLGSTLTNTYDSWGKMLSSTTNLGGTTSYTYEKLDNHDVRTIVYAPDGSESVSYTNKIGQTYKSSTKAFGQKSVFKVIKYDALGRKIKESEPYFEGEGTSWNTIEYDEYSRPIKATAFTGKIVETKYTKNSVTATETNANNRFKKQTFDALGNISSTEDKGGVIEFKYNAAGENIEAKYGTNIVTTQYDAWGRKIEFHDPSNGRYRYEYQHGFGPLTKTISPKGYKEYSYNNKGQLIAQKEISDDGVSTNKQIQFSYNDKGLLTSKEGTSKGKAFSSRITYDKYGRVTSSSEESFGKKYERKNIIYDPLSRVYSYQKSLTSSGKTTSVEIENIYDSRTGDLYQLKDKKTGKVLWELQTLNAKGQTTRAQLGAVEIHNTYDANGFLSNIRHASEVKQNLLSVSYAFNAIKNELNSRTTAGDFNILERFVYDENNRLTNWTNPTTGEMHHNVYDKEGRITENDQLGKIKFENSAKVYQPTGMTLNEKGAELLKNNLIQSISYNENNDPIFINGVKGDVRFEYGLSAMRQMASFGGEFLSENAAQNETAHGKYTRYYSEDASFEITLDHTTGKEKHILYIGGSPYESNIIFVKDYKDDEGSFKFLHKDYLGSILAISDEEGNKVEQRHYDAWGNLTHLQLGTGEILTGEALEKAVGQMLIDRGYTSHEHFFEVGIIHMNGRLYDPLLKRFLNADENIQDLHNTQNYNKYGYVFNNPLMFNDPSGEFFQFLFIGPLLMKSIIIGAAVGLASYTVGLAITGNLHQWNIGGALKSTFWGAVGGAASFGIGSIFSSTSGTLTALATSIKESIGGVGLALVQAGAHGISQGVLSLMQGGDFLSGAAGGFFGSLGASAFGAVAGDWANKAGGQIFFGALSGGIGAELSGGNFWQGAVTGGIVAGLNHVMHGESIIANDDQGDPSSYPSPQPQPDFRLNDGPVIMMGGPFDVFGIFEAAGMLIDSWFTNKNLPTVGKIASVGIARKPTKGLVNTLKKPTIKNSSIKGYEFHKNVGNKYSVYIKNVPAKNLSGEASSSYYKVFNQNGKTIKVYKDSYKIDGRFLHRRNIKPEYPNTPRYSR